MTTPDEWPRIEAALDAILDLDGDARQRALHRIEERDPALHAEILSLLQHSTDGDALLDQPAVLAVTTDDAGGAASVADLPAGFRIGAYQIVGLVGRGGMGEVYEAQRADGQYEQRVALKLLRRELADQTGRFQSERQTLARLDHPGIARLLDGGVADDGRPYMVMEFVQGSTLIDWCRTHHSPLPQRLALFVAVCEAVAFAHRNLVVHRDIKPGNVLVTDAGTVKLLDFGVAKLLSPIDYTETQFAPMTPGYAAPEQLMRGIVTTATDVYALGMLLFELLTGEPPWRLEELTLLAAIDKVLKEDPPAPSRFASERPAPPIEPRLLRGDLDAIVAKAVRKEPERRYGTAASLQADIERSVRHEPVSAREGARIYSTGRFLRRYRTLVVSTSITFLALLASTGVSVWQARQARLQAQRAEQVKGFVLSLLGDADTDAGAGATTTAADLLKSARRRVDEELAGQPAIRTELLTTIGYGLVGQGATADGADAALEAVNVGTAALGARHPKTLLAMVTYGEALVDLGRDADAIRELRAVVAATTDADLHEPDVAEARIGAKRWLASVLLNEGQAEEAIRLSRESIVDTRAARAVLPPSVAAQSYSSHANILTTARAEGQVEAAREALEEIRGAARGRVTVDTLDSRMLLGRALVNEGNPRAGLKELEATLPDAKRLFGAAHPVVAYNLTVLASAKLEGGDVRGAIDAYRATIDVDDRQGGDSSAFSRGRDRLGLAMGQLAAGQPADALAVLDEAIAQLRAASGESNPFVLWARSVRALALARLGRVADAEREVAELDARPWIPRQQAGHDARAAEIFGLAGRPEAAIARARVAVGRYGQADPALWRAGAQATLGTLLVSAGHYAEAVAPLEDARTVYQARQLMMSPEHAGALAALARARAALGDPSTGRALAAEANTFWRNFAPASAEARRAAALVDALTRQR